MRELEFKHGRSLNSLKFSPRTLDLDLLLFGDAIIEEDDLQLPRSDIENYLFVLQPLADIAPDLVHPILKKRIVKCWHYFLPKVGGLIFVYRIFESHFLKL